MKTKLILIGGGGHCKSCIEVVESTNQYEILGILDFENIGENILQYTILANDDLIEEKAGEVEFLITVGQIQSPKIRKKIFERVKKANGKLATVIASSAIVSKHSQIGEGTIVMHQSIVNAGSKLGVNNIINTKALIEHDCIIGNHNHISTNAILNGDCKVGNDNFVDSNTVCKNGLSIGNENIISFGSVVKDNIEDKEIYKNDFARKIEK